MTSSSSSSLVDQSLLESSSLVATSDDRGWVWSGSNDNGDMLCGLLVTSRCPGDDVTISVEVTGVLLRTTLGLSRPGQVGNHTHIERIT